MRTLRATAAATALVVALGACQMAVEFDLAFEADGGGTFTLRMALDDEFVRGFQQLANVARAQRGESVGLELLTDFFACLEERDWRVTRERPAGGLTLVAARDFDDVAGFEALLESMRCQEEGAAVDVPRLFTLDFAREDTFLRSTYAFEGSVDLRAAIAGDEDSRRLIEQLIPAAADRFIVQVSAAMPGSISVQEGGGVIEDGRAVWRPRLGSTLQFSAQSSRLKGGSVLLIAVPIAVLVAAAVLFVVRRRSPSLAEDDPFADLGASADESDRPDGE